MESLEEKSKEVYEVKLYDVVVDNNHFKLKGYIDEKGNLIMLGHDISELTSSVFGNKDYKYCYTFDPANTDRLKRYFSVEESNSLLDAISNFYHNHVSRDCDFKKLCKKEKINYVYQTNI